MRWLLLLACLPACAPAIGAAALRVINTVAPFGYAAYSAKTAYDEALERLKAEQEKERCSRLQDDSGDASCAQRDRR